MNAQAGFGSNRYVSLLLSTLRVFKSVFLKEKGDKAFLTFLTLIFLWTWLSQQPSMAFFQVFEFSAPASVDFHTGYYESTFGGAEAKVVFSVDEADLPRILHARHFAKVNELAEPIAYDKLIKSDKYWEARGYEKYFDTVHGYYSDDWEGGKSYRLIVGRKNGKIMVAAIYYRA